MFIQVYSHCRTGFLSGKQLRQRCFNRGVSRWAFVMPLCIGIVLKSQEATTPQSSDSDNCRRHFEIIFLVFSLKLKGTFSPLPQQLVHCFRGYSTSFLNRDVRKKSKKSYVLLVLKIFLRLSLPEDVFEDCLEHTVLILKNHETAMDQ